LIGKYIFDLQIHSNYSWDGKSSVEDIIQHSKSLGLSGISITDHETIKGGILGAKLTSNDESFTVIPSTEIATNFGDIIVMFVKGEIKTNDFFEIKDIASSEDLLLMLPHPGRGITRARKVAEHVDAIETINGHSRFTQNLKSIFLRDEFDKTAVAGSDAHTKEEIGRCRTIFNGLTEEEIRKDLKKGNTKVEGLMNTISNVPKSLKRIF